VDGGGGDADAGRWNVPLGGFAGAAFAGRVAPKVEDWKIAAQKQFPHDVFPACRAAGPAEDSPGYLRNPAGNVARTVRF